jgi:uncharacterized membrane protein YkoI
MRLGRAIPLALAGAVLLGTIAPAAFAAGRDEVEEQTALQGAKVTLTQAITVAEQQTGGRAFDAGVDVDKGKARIKVETNGPKGVQTVIIDADSGQVVGTHTGGEED